MVFTMSTEEKKKEMDLEAEKRNAEMQKRENELLKKEISLKQKELIMLGYPEERAAKVNNAIALDNLIEVQKEANEDEKKKKKEEPEEIKGVINAGTPAVTFPDGQKQKIDPRQNEQDAEMQRMYFLDPQRVGRTVNVAGKGARVNYLPPTDEFPWYRQI